MPATTSSTATTTASPSASAAMSSISSLLNHEPAPERRMSRSSASDAPDPHAPAATTFDAASALTALASRELPSPTATAHAPPRRTSSIGSHAAPVEPSPPIDLPQPHSPTLEQYHHGSRSPEQQRRQSLLARTASPPPILAPIQDYAGGVLARATQEPQHVHTALGADVSQVVAPSSGEADGRDATQNREPAYVRDEPTTAQIREPEPMKQQSPRVKTEPSRYGSRDASPSVSAAMGDRRPSLAADDVDAETRKAIEALKQNDLGLRTKRTASVSESIASPTDTKPAPAPSKKRPASAALAVKKKGTAALKKSAKKRKLDTDADPTNRSVTPTGRPPKSSKSKKGSQAGTPIASSPAPDNSSQVHASDDEADSSEDSSLYCICRKPDNHKWMIGCDGGCDDWFHGSCVDMAQADEDLVDKFICPNCETAGRGETTWKPMCRRDGCRKPARVAKGGVSKYCSDECGRLFMQESLTRTAGAKKPKKKKKGNTDDGTDGDEEPTPLGGVVRAKDLKALTMVSKDIEAFKRLGSGVLSPPRTASPTRPGFDGNGTNPDDGLPYTNSELGHLNALRSEMAVLKEKLEVLNDREKFVSMAREQAARCAEREKIKPKEFCGYDARLSWSDTEFVRWRKSKHGSACFQFSTLAPTPEQLTTTTTTDADGDTDMSSSPEERVCLRKRCQKHPQWQKLNLQDARFEEMEVVEAIKECEKEERAVRERARRRGAKDRVEAEIVGVEGGRDGGMERREGWVEVVGA